MQSSPPYAVESAPCTKPARRALPVEFQTFTFLAYAVPTPQGTHQARVKSGSPAMTMNNRIVDKTLICC